MNRRFWAIVATIAIFAAMILWVLRKQSPSQNTEKPASLKIPRSVSQSSVPYPRGKVLQLPSSSLRPAPNFGTNTQSLADQTIEARDEFVSTLKTKSCSELFEMWSTEVKARNDSLKLDFTANWIGLALRNPGQNTTATLLKIKEFLSDSNNDDYSRWHLAQVLGQAATPEALQIILDLIATVQQPEMKNWLLEQIVRTSQEKWDGRVHEELAAPLENAWKTENPGSDALPYLGQALASIGGPQSIDLIFLEIQRGGRTISDFEQKADDKSWIAFASLEHVRNPEAIPFLNLKLIEGPPDSITTAAAGDCLSAMGKSEATSTLLHWIKTVPSDVSAYIDDWFIKIRDERSARLVNSSIKNQNFINPANHKALQSIFDLWLSQHSENLRPALQP